MYSAIGPEIIKKKIKDCIEQWNVSMKSALEEFDDKYLKNA